MTTAKNVRAELAIVIGFLFLYFIFKWPPFVTISFALGLCFLFLPSRWIVLFMKLWWGLTEFIGRINSWILLTLIFYIFLTPLSWLFRLTKKNQMTTKPEGSSFVNRNHTYQATDLEKLW